MSLHNYRISQELNVMCCPFYSLIMAAMREADTDNLEVLKAGWPRVWEELQQRYNAPGGCLPDEMAEMEED